MKEKKKRKKHYFLHHRVSNHQKSIKIRLLSITLPIFASISFLLDVISAANVQISRVTRVTEKRSFDGSSRWEKGGEGAFHRPIMCGRFDERERSTTGNGELQSTLEYTRIAWRSVSGLRSPLLARYSRWYVATNYGRSLVTSLIGPSSRKTARWCFAPRPRIYILRSLPTASIYHSYSFFVPIRQISNVKWIDHCVKLLETRRTDLASRFLSLFLFHPIFFSNTCVYIGGTICRLIDFGEYDDAMGEKYG